MDKGKSYVFKVSIGDASADGRDEKAFYNLKVKDDAVSLCDITTNDVVLEWPYNYIRRYGKCSSHFTIDVGRRSESGDGVFKMETREAEIIMNRIKEKIKHIVDKGSFVTKNGNKERHKAELPPPPCGNPQNDLPPSHKYINMKSSREGSAHKSSTYTNSSFHAKQDKEEVVISRGEVRIGAEDRRENNDDNLPAACHQHYTPMLTTTNTRHSDGDYSQYTQLPQAYVNLPANNTSLSEHYLTPVHKRRNQSM